MESTVELLDAGVAVVRLAGRLNMVTAGELREQLATTIAAGNARVVVDLAGVDFIDSSGLGALISGLKTARQAGGDLRIAAPTEQVRLVLQLTNLERVLTPYPSPQSAYSDG
jgi:anti-sigma B factor antagonist